MIIVDDASDSPLAQALSAFSSRFASLTFLRNETNQGFAVSCNRGARVAQGRYLLFLNNDTEVCQGWWPPLAAVLDGAPNVGIVAPKLIFPDNTIQHCGMVWKDLAPSQAQPHHIYYRMPANVPCVLKSRDYAVVTGACILLRRVEFLSIGPFDERYENGWEDTDLCYAYRSKGMRIRYCADSCIIHHQSLTLKEEISALPANNELSRVNNQLERCDGSEVTAQARGAAEKMEILDEQLVAVRQRFDRNRAHFFSKWEQYVRRDDFIYYRSDGFSADPDIPRYAPEIRGGLGRPFEQDEVCSSAVMECDRAEMVSIIVLAWNQLDLTRQCVASIEAHTPEPHEIIFVDNASTDDTLPWFKEIVARHPTYRLVQNQTNLGYARGCNQGANAAKGAYLLFLNNDTMVTPGWLAPLLEATQPGVGAVGCKLLYPDGRVQHAGIRLIDGIPDHPYRYFNADTPEVSEGADMDMVTGACLLICRETFMLLGGFDETYRNGVEDVDLCLRLREAGYRVVYQPKTAIYHYEGQSEGRFDHVRPNLEIFFRRWNGRFDPDGRFLPPGTPRLFPAEKSFLFKEQPARVVWQGSQFVYHSLALVNRELCLQLIQRGIELQILPYEPDQFEPTVDPRFELLVQRVRRPLSGPADVVVRHQWPPDFTPPVEGHWVMIQPWEFGSIPLEWVAPMSSLVDEIWVPSKFVRDCYIEGGVPAEQIQVVPNGVDTGCFTPGLQPLPLRTSKRFRFLFVGGTIRRKGIDVLLTAYRKTFSAGDDVCLVIKDMGGDSFYRGQTARDMITRFQQQLNAPEIEYIDRMLAPGDMARLYNACHCLVHPYRGEGFGLPIAEAMACGLAVIVTGEGPALDFCSSESGWLIPASRTVMSEKLVGDIATVDYPWLFEPDIHALEETLHEAAANSAEVARRGSEAARHIHADFSWDRVAERLDERIFALRRQPIRRLVPRGDESSQTASRLVSIIILTFNCLDITKECMASIQRHTPETHEIIFIDNGSTDGTDIWLRELASHDSRYRFVLNGENLGLIHGYNQGIEIAQGDYLLLLHNDVVVAKGWLSGLLACFRNRPDTGIIGPLTNNISGIQRIPDSPTAPQDGLDEFAAHIQTQFSGRRVFSRSIAGFCMLFSKDLFNRVGYLDESLGSGNFGVDDYCLRAELEGFRNLIAGDVFIHNYGRASFSGNNMNHATAMLGNRALFNRKWSKDITEPVLASKVIALKVIEEANRLSRQGQSNAAVDVLLKQGIAQLPDEIRFYLLIADIFLEARMGSEAFQTLEQAPHLNSDQVALYLLACAACLLGEIDVVRDVERRMEQYHSSCLHLNLVRGLLNLHNRDFAVAVDEFLAVIHNDPSNDGAFLGLAQVAEAKGDLCTAFDMYLWTFSIAPANREAARGLSHLADTHEKQLKTRQLLEDALRFRDDDRDLRFLLIDLLIQLGETRKALEHAERAMVLFGADPGLVNAACALRRQIGPLSISPASQANGCSVSLCMIVKDEAKSLPRCLASLKPIVDEIIVCDTGSIDATRDIAKAFGARIVDHHWTGDFSAARNCSLAAANGAWLLVMDADEMVSPLDYDAFRSLVQGSGNQMTAYTIMTRNYTNKLVEKWQEHDGLYPVEEAGRGWMPSDKVRLFPNSPEIRFENTIHEMVEPSLERKGIPCPLTNAIVVHHYGYLDDDRQEAKKMLYYETGLKKLQESGGSPKAIVELAIQAAGIERYQEAIELWKRALAYNPKSALAWFNLGYAQLCLGHYDQAFDATKRSLELQRDYREATANMALIETLRGRHLDALEILGTRDGNGEEYVMFELIRAVAYCCSHNPERGGELFRAVVDRQIEFGKFIETTVRHLRQSGRDRDAEAVVAVAREAGCCVAESMS